VSAPVDASGRDARLARQVASIEGALRELGWLSGPVGAPRAVTSAFGIGEMPFQDWLAGVFLPRASEAVATGAWPASSQVGTAAIRNLDGLPACDRLVGLLCEFDSLVIARQGSR
jgi:uncharacterized protein YqcC (DUF446 family)